MSGKKRCPLRQQDIQTPETQNCIKEECEWWIKFTKGEEVVKAGCAICFIAAQKLPIVK